MKAVNVAFMMIAVTIMFAMAQPVKALSYIGVNYPWVGYGWGFGSSYNSSTANSNLYAIRNTYKCNYVRIWLCEGLDGLSVNSSGTCSGISSTNIANIKSFVSYANSIGLKVECVFINYMDVQNHSNMITSSTNRTALATNGLLPLVKALNSYNVMWDLINEANIATNAVTWSQLRAFATTAISVCKNAGYTPSITMSDQNPTDFTNYFSGTVGGLGFKFYEYHAYNNTGYIQVNPSNVGNAPLMLSEFGPSSAWNNNSSSVNNTCIDDFMYNAKNQGYLGLAAWCYVADGSNWQLNSNSAMWTIEYYANLWGL